MKDIDHLLAQGDLLIEGIQLEKAEDAYGEAFKLADRQKNSEGYQDQLICILKLAEVYARQDEGSTKTAALLNYALNFCTNSKILAKLTEDQQRHFQEWRASIQDKIAKVETNFIQQLSKKAGCTLINFHPYTCHNKIHRAKLNVIRKEVKNELKTIDACFEVGKLFISEERNIELENLWSKAIEGIYHNIAEKMKEFIRDLLKECRETLGNPPCEYVIIGLGSLAREEMTPYSDLEFAILIQDGLSTEDMENAENYFHQIITFLHLKIINLGETILPAMAIRSLNNYDSKSVCNWFYDEVTPRGFAFDGAMPWASKTPGRK